MSVEKPKRIQLRRTKGWRKPDGAIVVSRPSKFGNPFTVDGCRNAGYQGTDDELRVRCIEAYRAWLFHKDGWLNWQGEEADRRKAAILEALPELRGKDLACWCGEGSRCHADVLIEHANR
jgi:hypothetical protein